jgi:triacylglycerol lipase
MDIGSATHETKSYVFALLSKAAYRDNCLKTFDYWGIGTDYSFLEREDSQAHVGTNENTIVVVFRGTTFTDIDDIVADLKIWPKTHGVGWVHAGFRRHSRKIMPLVFDYIKRHPNKKIIIAGHSMGAAMSLYIAQELHWAGYSDITIYSYGSPRMGNRRYVRSIPIEHHRFVNCNDIIARLPWMFLGYRHHGTMHYISADGEICRPLAWQRFRDAILSRLQSWARLRPINVIADHNIMGYIEKLSKIKSQS